MQTDMHDAVRKCLWLVLQSQRSSHPCGVLGIEKAWYVCVAVCQTECAHRCACRAKRSPLCLRKCK